VLKRIMIIGMLLLLSVSVVSAQDDSADDCIVDLALINALIAEAETLAAEGSQDEALATLASARDKLDALLADCDTLPTATDIPDLSAPDIELTESITVDDPTTGSYALSYPSGWYAQNDDGFALIANDRGILDESVDGTPELASGQIVVFAFPLSEELLFALDVNLASSPIVVGEVFIDALFIVDEGDAADFDDIQELTLDSNPAAQFSGELTFDGNTSQGTLLVVQLEEAFMILVARYEGDFEAELQAIAGSSMYGDFLGAGDF